MRSSSLLGHLVGGGLLLLVLPLVLDVYVLAVGLIYGLLGLSLGLIWGYGGILCFGQSALFGLGAYGYAVLSINTQSPWLSLLLATLLVGLFALLLAAVLFSSQLTDVYLAVVTLIVTLILFKFLNASAGEAYAIGTARLGGFNGMPGYPTLTLPWNPDEWLIDLPLYGFCALLLLGSVLLCHAVLQTRFGRTAVAVRENPLRVALIGVNPALVKSGLFTLSGLLAGLAGALYANWAEIVTPGLFSLALAAEIIIWVIVGGVGTLWGPVLGAMVLSLLKFWLGQQSLIDNSVLLGALMVAVVLWLPGGLWPALKRVCDRWRPAAVSRRTAASRRQGQGLH